MNYSLMVKINFHYREKLLNAIIYFVKHTKYCGKLKLLKLLYILDFVHFKQTGKSVTGLDYYAWEHGPVPKTLFEELNIDKMPDDLKETISIKKSQGGFLAIRPKRSFDPKYFSQRELDLLKKISYVFKEAKAEHMKEFTHLKNKPWDKTLKEKGLYQKIDYLLAIDDSPDSLSLEVARERQEEREEMINVFESE